jgi:hypothetical protein
MCHRTWQASTATPWQPVNQDQCRAQLVAIQTECVQSVYGYTGRASGLSPTFWNMSMWGGERAPNFGVSRFQLDLSKVVVESGYELPRFTAYS